MSARFEVVRTDAGWHSRFVAANGKTVWSTEVHKRRRTAEDTIVLLALTFGVMVAERVDPRGFLWVTGRDIQVREVDERTEATS